MAATVQRKTQLIVPAELQRQAGFKPGDQFEFKATRGKITIVSKPAVLSPFMQALTDVQTDARDKGLHKMTMKQINELIAKVRKEKRNQVKAK